MAEYRWISIFTGRKNWRRREWEDRYWITYGLFNGSIASFGTNDWVIEEKDNGSAFLLTCRKSWGRYRRIDRWRARWEKE